MAMSEYEIQARERALSVSRFVVKVTVGVVVGCVALWLLVAWLSPKLNLYRAETERRAVIAEARAEAEAAQFTAERQVEIATAQAEADRIRAAGIADANATIAESLTPEYVRWYFVDRLDNIDGQIIYVPTEAGVPLPEAGRAVPQGG